jgi:hypothetical protein
MADDISSITATPKLGIRVSDAALPPVPPVEPSISSVRPDTGSQPNFAHEEKLVWPPLAEDLKRLYLDQKLSASKIATVYGLKYVSAKTAESTILYHLKRNGIARRDPAAHVRKVSDSMVDDWMARYQKGESLKQIAGTSVTAVTVFNHLHKRGLGLRDKVEAQIKAVTRFQKAPFDGNEEDKAYLLGLARGDLNVARHGRAIRVKTSSTHPAMIDLVASLFIPYGPIRVYPYHSRLVGYEWTIETELDQTFRFLLDGKLGTPRIRSSRVVRIAYLAGLFDAEGSLWLRGNRRFEPRMSFTNTDLGLLNWVRDSLDKMGFHPYLGLPNVDGVRQIQMWRVEEVLKLVRILPVRHPEKKSKDQTFVGFLEIMVGAESRLVETDCGTRA